MAFRPFPNFAFVGEWYDVVFWLVLIVLAGLVLIAYLRSLAKHLLAFDLPRAGDISEILPNKPSNEDLAKLFGIPMLNTGDMAKGVKEKIHFLLQPRLTLAEELSESVRAIKKFSEPKIISCCDIVCDERGRNGAFSFLWKQISDNAKNKRRILILTDVELIFNYSDKRRVVLDFIESAWEEKYVERLLIFSELDPLYRLGSDAWSQRRQKNEADEAKRIEEVACWTAVFGRSKFQKCRVPAETGKNTGDTPQKRLSLLEKEDSAWEDTKIFETDLIPGNLRKNGGFDQRIRHDEELRECCEEELCKRFVSETQLVETLAELETEFYRRLWVACSRDEKILLHRMVRGDLANPKNRATILSLEGRGLIVRRPEFALANRSFARFVLNAETPETIAAWRAELPRGSWSVWRIPLGIILSFILFFVAYTSADLFKAALALGPILFGAIPVLLQYFPTLR